MIYLAIDLNLCILLICMIMKNTSIPNWEYVYGRPLLGLKSIFASICAINRTESSNFCGSNIVSVL